MFTVYRYTHTWYGVQKERYFGSEKSSRNWLAGRPAGCVGLLEKLTAKHPVAMLNGEYTRETVRVVPALGEPGASDASNPSSKDHPSGETETS